MEQEIRSNMDWPIESEREKKIEYPVFDYLFGGHLNLLICRSIKFDETN